MSSPKNATAEQISEIRDGFQAFLDANGLGKFDKRDIDKLMKNDHLVNRYFVHVSELNSANAIENTVNMIVKALEWRKKTGIADLRPEDLNSNLKEKGSLFIRNRDVDGKRMFIFDVKKHFRGKHSTEDVRQFVLYLVERAEREEKGEQLTMVFDCAGCGMKNMDMDLIQYMIGLFKDYIPNMLNYILVFEMPWVLNAAWKIIKGWLPAPAVRKIKFVNKTSINEYVRPDQQLLAWGGEDDWEYEFLPESFDSEVEEVSVQDSAMTNGIHKRSVHFSPKRSESVQKTNTVSEEGLVRSTSRSSSTTSLSTISRNSSFASVGGDSSLLKVMPPDEITFCPTPKSDLMGTLHLENVSTTPVAFKLKTTSPEKYRVRPGMACIPPGVSETVEIHVLSRSKSIQKDRFLITAVAVATTALSQQQIAEATKRSKPETYQLRCSIGDSSKPDAAASVATTAAKGNASGVGVVGDDKLQALTKKVTALTETTTALKEDLAMVRMLLYVLVALVGLLFIVILWRTSYDTVIACEDAAATDGNPVIGEDSP